MITQASTKADTLITITKRTSDKIIRDLIRLDLMDSIHSIDVYKISTLENKVRFLEKAVKISEEELLASKKSNSLSEQQLAIREEELDIIKKELKKEKRKKFLVGAAGVAVIILLII